MAAETSSPSSAPGVLVRGACPHDCPDTCATLTEVRAGRAVRFLADADHPVTQGWLCAKVRPYLNRVYSPGIDAGDYLYISGQGPRRPDGSLPATFEAQVRQALDNVKSVVQTAGLTM